MVCNSCGSWIGKLLLTIFKLKLARNYELEGRHGFQTCCHKVSPYHKFHVMYN